MSYLVYQSSYQPRELALCTWIDNYLLWKSLLLSLRQYFLYLQRAGDTKWNPHEQGSRLRHVCVRYCLPDHWYLCLSGIWTWSLGPRSCGERASQLSSWQFPHCCESRSHCDDLVHGISTQRLSLSVHDWENDFQAASPSTARHVMITFGIVHSLLLLAIFCPSINVAFELLGGTCSSFICFGLPALYILKLESGSVYSPKKRRPLLVVLGAGLISVISTGVTLMSIIANGWSNAFRVQIWMNRKYQEKRLHIMISKRRQRFKFWNRLI